MKKLIVIIIIFNIFMLCYSNDIEDFLPSNKNHFSILSENDAFLLKLDLSHGYPDRYYTAGNSLVYSSNELDLNDEANLSWGKYLYFLKYIDPLQAINSKRFTSFSIALTSKLFTPSSNKAAFNEYDRPYAGLLFLSLGVNHRFKNAKQLIWLDMGFMGALAAGNQIQNGIHKLIRVKRFEGWNNQVAGRGGFYFNADYLYLHRFYIFKSPYFSSDISINSQVSIKNISIHGQVGGVIRAGFNLDSNFLASKIDAYDTNYNDKFFMYFFIAIDNKFILFNRLITGVDNNFNKLKINNYIFSHEYGFNIGYKGFGLSTSFNYLGKEFTTQAPSNYFGSIALHFAF